MTALQERVSVAEAVTPASPSAPRATRGPFPWNYVAPVIALVIILFGWQIAVVVSEVPARIVPAPSRVITAGLTDWEGLLAAAMPTLQVTLLGLGASIVAAILVASLLSFFIPLRQAVLPILIGAQSVPVIVLAPLFVIWFGFGIWPKTLLVMIVTMLPLTISTLQGLLSASSEAEELLRSMGANRFQVFLRLKVYSALPYFVTGLRVVTTFAVVAAIFAEYVGAEAGLGIYMQTQAQAFRTDLVFAAVFVSIVMGLLLFALTYLVEALLQPWERRRKASAK